MIGSIERNIVYTPDFGGMDMVPTPVGRQEAQQITLQEKAPLFYHLDIAPIALHIMRHLAETQGSVDFYVNGPTSSGKQRTIEHFFYVVQRVGEESVFGEDASDEEREIEEELKTLKRQVGSIHYEVSNTAMGIMKARVVGTVTSPIGYFERSEVDATSEAMAKMNRESNASSPKPRLRGIDTPGLHSHPGWPFGVKAIEESLALSQADKTHKTIILWLLPTLDLQKRGLKTREKFAELVRREASPEDLRIAGAANNMIFEETDAELEARKRVINASWGGKPAAELVRKHALEDTVNSQQRIREIDEGIPPYTIFDLWNERNEGLAQQIEAARAESKRRGFSIPEEDFFIRENPYIFGKKMPTYQVTIFEDHAMYDIGEGQRILEERQQQK